MEGRLLLKNCSLFRADGRVRAGVSVLIEGGLISAIAPDEQLPVRPGDWEVRCGGRLVGPGLVDCHTRLVSGSLIPWTGDLLLRPYMARIELEQKFELQLTPGEVEALTASAMARGLRQGVTLFTEALHAPRHVEASLEAQATVAHRLGGRLVNSHASCSGLEGLPGPEMVEANARYVQAHRGDALVRGSLGVMSSSCADDDLLRIVGQLKESLGVGAHLRLAECDDDLAITWARHGVRVVNRFEGFGLLGGGSVGAHARAIDRNEASRLARSRTLIALDPRAAQTLEGGAAMGMEAVLVSQNLVGLGTSGACSLWEELAASFTGVMALARAGRMLDPDNLLSSFLAGGPAEFCTMIFGKPSGAVEVGSLADLVVFDLVPAEEVSSLTPHLLMQLSQSTVAWTIVDGRVVVREGQLLGADALEISREGAKALASVWRRAGVGGTAA
jgi:cytosine/adenosine deaminase-related metal-dependent hydrolase